MLAHFAHIHTFPLASSGTRANASREIFTFAHQHSLFPATPPQSFGPPQMGQRSGRDSFIPSPGVVRRTPAPAEPPHALPPAPDRLPTRCAPARDCRTRAAVSARFSRPRPVSDPVLK